MQKRDAHTVAEIMSRHRRHTFAIANYLRSPAGGPATAMNCIWQALGLHRAIFAMSAKNAVVLDAICRVSGRV
jgi:hypothetical protein